VAGAGKRVRYDDSAVGEGASNKPGIVDDALWTLVDPPLPRGRDSNPNRRELRKRRVR
jgi:hypothetical protein